MEIQSLRLVITEKDVNDLLAGAIPKDQQQVRDLRVRLAPEGVYVSGIYKAKVVLMAVDVNFESVWQPSIRSGRVAMTLVQVSASGLNVRMLRDTVLNSIVNEETRDFLAVDGDTLLLNLDRLLARVGINARTNLSGVRCGEGTLTLEAGM